MNQTVASCRTSYVQKVTIARDAERATTLGFEHEAGLMVFVPVGVTLGPVVILAAPTKAGPFLPIVGAGFDVAGGQAVPITAAFAAPFVKFVADIDEPVELDVSLTS